MEKIQFDSGVKSYKLGSGVLKFNPADPNVYARFLEATEKLKALEREMVNKAQTLGQDGGALVALMQDADRKMKDTLNWVFGGGNDFDAMLGGVNLLAVAQNGERVATNLFAALEPVLVAGAQCCAAGKAAQAVEQAKRRRGDRGPLSEGAGTAAGVSERRNDTLSVTPSGVTPLPEGEAGKC